MTRDRIGRADPCGDRAVSRRPRRARPEPRRCADSPAPGSWHPSENLDRLAARALRVRRQLFGLVLVEEVRLTRRVEILAVERRLLAAISAQRGHVIEQVARMARAQRSVRRLVVAAMQGFRNWRVARSVSATAV